MKQGAIETIIGILILALAAWFFFYVYKISGSAKPTDGYAVNANFENIEGLTIGSDVKLSGIKVGYVENIILEKDTFFANLTLRIDNDIEVPKDSRVIVSTSGLVGNKYVRINPGASDTMISEGEKFVYTQSALNVEDLIAKLMYSITTK